jgi:hypothetical protein
MEARGSDEGRVRLLTSGRDSRSSLPRMVLDTDAYNEIDDQFALVHAVLSSDRVRLEAVYAAPFDNPRSTGPGIGMRESYEEIQRVLDALSCSGLPVLEGATEWLTGQEGDYPVSAATQDLIDRARSGKGEPLYVVAIGAPTNVSAALLQAPDIIDRVVVVWLGGNSFSWPTAREFNLQQDLRASRVLFDSGVALVHVPCFNVADHLSTTRDEIEHYVRPAGKVGQFLAERYAQHVEDGPGVSKVIWDLAATAWLLEPSWATDVLTQSPVLTDEMTWSRDPGRHLVAEVTYVRRDAIFGDFFVRLAEHAARSK